MIAFYGLSLVYGSTMLCHSIKANVIRRYLGAEGSVAINSKQLDSLKDACDQKSQLVESVISKVKSCKAMPSRRKLFSFKMMMHLS